MSPSLKIVTLTNTALPLPHSSNFLPSVTPYGGFRYDIVLIFWTNNFHHLPVSSSPPRYLYTIIHHQKSIFFHIVYYVCVSPPPPQVLPEEDPEDPTRLVYQAASPDEGALVTGAKCLGYKCDGSFFVQCRSLKYLFSTLSSWTPWQELGNTLIWVVQKYHL